jgi:hypothetical protein
LPIEQHVERRGFNTQVLATFCFYQVAFARKQSAAQAFYGSASDSFSLRNHGGQKTIDGLPLAR